MRSNKMLSTERSLLALHFGCLNAQDLTYSGMSKDSCFLGRLVMCSDILKRGVCWAAQCVTAVLAVLSLYRIASQALPDLLGPFLASGPDQIEMLDVFMNGLL